VPFQAPFASCNAAVSARSHGRPKAVHFRETSFLLPD
jgi:hypothetical protein